MRGRSYFLAGLFLAAAANASAQNNAQVSPEASGPSAALKSLLENCSVHKFETTIEVPGEDGKPQPRKVRMCGTEGQTDAEWILTLNDAAVKTATSSMPQEAKNQIIAAVSAEIARLKAASPKAPAGPEVARSPNVSTGNAISRDYASLPPLPSSTNVAPPSVLAPTSAAGEVQRTAAASASALAAPAPRLTLRCATAGDRDRPVECDSIEPSTLIVLRADEALPRGVQMRFLRRGTQRAELDLPPLKPGQTTTLRVPDGVCEGVAHSKVEIQAGGGSMGQYDLRC